MQKTGTGRGPAVFVIAVVAVIAAAGLAVILAVVLLVTIGIHQEERRLTFARQRGPTATARLARLIVGRYVRPTEREPPAAGGGATRVAAPGESRATSTEPGRSAA